MHKIFVNKINRTFNWLVWLSQHFKFFDEEKMVLKSRPYCAHAQNFFFVSQSTRETRASWSVIWLAGKDRPSDLTWKSRLMIGTHARPVQTFVKNFVFPFFLSNSFPFWIAFVVKWRLMSFKKEKNQYNAMNPNGNHS